MIIWTGIISVLMINRNKTLRKGKRSFAKA
jgi:hypothetical protein